MELTGNRNGHRPNMDRIQAMVAAIQRTQTMYPRFRFDMPIQDAIDLLTAQYQIAVEHRHCKFVLDDNTIQNLVSLAEYITSPNPKFGVLLCGTCGNGKTTLVYAFQKTINYLEGRGFFKEWKEFYDVGLMMVDARELLQISRNIKEFQEIRGRSMLAIDDMGKEPAEVRDYGNITNPLVDLIEYRYQHQLFKVITTNLDPGQIRDKYGSRVADRFREMLHVIVFQDISYRN